MYEIDENAKAIALREGMPSDVHIPIAARNKDAIIKYIGTINYISALKSEEAFIVTPYFIPLLNNKLPLWKIKESLILHSKNQIWVHVDYKNYRNAYLKACPDENIKGLSLDHILNRRVARLKGFNYIRIVPVSPSVNTSSGGVTEKYSFDFHNSEYMKKKNKENKSFIQYADIADIVKILNLKTGGRTQYVIQDSLKLIIEEQ